MGQKELPCKPRVRGGICSLSSNILTDERCYTGGKELVYEAIKETAFETGINVIFSSWFQRCFLVLIPQLYLISHLNSLCCVQTDVSIKTGIFIKSGKQHLRNAPVFNAFYLHTKITKNKHQRTGLFYRFMIYITRTSSSFNSCQVSINAILWTHSIK